MDRKSIESLVSRVLGKSNKEVERVIESGVRKELSHRRFKERLGECLKSARDVGDLADEIEKAMKKTARKRPIKEEPRESNGRDRDRGERSSEKRSKTDADRRSDETRFDKDAVRRQLDAAKASIETKKKELGITDAKRAARIMPNMPIAVRAQGPIGQREAAKIMAHSMDKKARLAMLNERIATRTSGGLVAPIKEETDGTKLIDATSGRSLELGPQAPTFMINAQARKHQQYMQAQKETAEADTKPTTSKVVEKVVESVHNDPRIDIKPAGRSRRGFRFHDKGEFEALAARQRNKTKLEKLQAEISSASLKTGISTAVKLAMVAPKTQKLETEVPLVEWWDVLLTPDGEDFANKTPEELAEFDYTKSSMINNLIEHPIQLRPPDESTDVKYLKVYLTTKERKKLRRQTRKETLREKQEKIRLGLEPTPEPKVKISNMMRVLGTDAVLNPTKMEKHVRDQVAKRVAKHEEDNESRKLTKEQKRDKMNRKIAEDTSLGVNVALYRVNSLNSPKLKFKVEMNAKQLKMTGVVILHKDINVVVVEGGPKQQAFFKKLMLHRIKWTDDGKRHKAGDEDDPLADNECHLVWEGMTRKRNFGPIQYKQCVLAKQASELFDKHGVPHYWHMVLTSSILKDELHVES